jgi:hypothetical protein
MAIDTAARRFSSIGPGLPWSGPIIPDGVIAASDRRALTWCYSGLAAGNSYSIEAESGVFTMTGSDAELTPTTGIDTSIDRFAAMNIGIPWRGINLLPTGSIGRNQRQILGGFYTPYATGPTYTITCESGTFTWDGEPSFSDFEITGIAGEFVMTGNDATLLATRTLYATAGVFAMTGNDANLTKFTERTLVAVSGVFTMTGSDAAFERPQEMQAFTGTFGMEGYPVTFTWTSAEGVPYPDPGAIPVPGSGGWGMRPKKPKKKRIERYEPEEKETPVLVKPEPNKYQAKKAALVETVDENDKKRKRRKAEELLLM